MKTHFNADWRNWIATNVNAGNDLNGIFKILLDSGFEHNAIVNVLNFEPTVPVSSLVNPLINAINNNGVAISPHQIKTTNARILQGQPIDLRTIDGFLTPNECEKVITLIKQQLRPSELANSGVDQSYRNSRTCDLGRLNSDFIEAIDLRICKLMGIHRAYSEFIEGQYYEVGQEFKAHTDYFDKEEFTANCAEFGQRTFTVMIYLNAVEQGGETSFGKIGETLTPKAGTAVIWNNLNPDGTPNQYTLHQAHPVINGNKAIITKWFRSKPAHGYEYLPMLTSQVNNFSK